MNRKNIYNLFNLQITAKIILGTTLVLTIFGFISYIYFQNIKEEKGRLSKVTNLTKNSSMILDINREISEMQRLVKVYSSTGGKTIVEKIKRNHKTLIQKLNEVGKSTNSESRKELIATLKKVLISYGDNIDSLEERFKFRDTFLNERLPSLFLRGEIFFESELEKYRSKKHKNKLLNVQKILNDWYKVNNFAIKFLEKKDFKYKKELRKLLKEIKELNDLSDFKKEFRDKTKDLSQEYQKVFNQAVQANRIYLSLVNVVMAGDAIEFTKISGKLREDSIRELEALLTISDESFEKNKRMIGIFLTTGLLLLILIGFYYQVNIAKGIKIISDTFEGFINGNLEKDIPGLQRTDEIGQLARAADMFREVSIKNKEAQKKAEELNLSKSRFLATMSHEIRTPMNAIISCTNLLYDENPSEEIKEMLNTIKTSGDSLLVLINDILDFSKIESGKMSLENSIFNLKECLHSVNDLLNTKAQLEGVNIIIDSKSEYPEYIKGDVTRLRQVLVNLVGNGIKFSHSEVIIKIKTEDKNKGVQLFFSIKDNGIGISKDKQKSLFKEFSQVDASTTRKFGGTGLGLAICKGIVEAMNGKIGVKSEEGSGAEFYFYFPTTVESLVSSTNSEEEILLDHANERTKLKILLAEDNNVNQMVATKMIKKIGYRIDIASNGLEAVEAVRRVDYDIIFMDQHMPEMDGVEATIKIRALKIKQPLIYALTASAFKEDKDRCLNAGMDGFLTKPIIKAELVKAINICLTTKKDKNAQNDDAA